MREIPTQGNVYYLFQCKDRAKNLEKAKNLELSWLLEKSVSWHVVLLKNK